MTEVDSSEKLVKSQSVSLHTDQITSLERFIEIPDMCEPIQSRILSETWDATLTGAIKRYYPHSNASPGFLRWT